MFALAILSLAATALALEVNTPDESIMSSANVTITWESESNDTNFNIHVYNQIFNDQYAVANNVNVSQHAITLGLPEIPVGDGYTYRFTNISDDTDVYAASENISVIAFDAAVASTTTFGSSASETGSSSSSSSSTGTGTSTSDTAAATESDNGARTIGASAVGILAGLVALAL